MCLYYGESLQSILRLTRLLAPETMSVSPLTAAGSGGVVRCAIDSQYADRQRADSLKWIFINAALFLLFTMDLLYSCEGETSALHWVEACLACAAAASGARHALRLAGGGAAPCALSATQRRLLGLPARPQAECEPVAPRTPPPLAPEEPASLSPARSWRGDRSPRTPPSPPSPPADRSPADLFISDQRELDRYLSAASAESLHWSGEECGAAAAGAPPPYQVSSPRSAAPAERAPPGAAGGGLPWRRLEVEGARLAQLTLNLRRWVHGTVVAPLARELAALDAALAGAGHEARAGGASPARLVALAAGAPPALGARVRRVLPFLRPFPEQAYVVRRVRELARSPCLAPYRWAGGGAGWDAARCPPDAELLLHLLAAYLDAVAPGGPPPPDREGAFSAAHLSRAPAPPPCGPGALALHRVSARPPHYAVVVERQVVEPAPGRDNLLHCVLVFLAAAARREPPALLRLHLGPAGLNMLWILHR